MLLVLNRLNALNGSLVIFGEAIVEDKNGEPPMPKEALSDDEDSPLPATETPVKHKSNDVDFDFNLPDEKLRNKVAETRLWQTRRREVVQAFRHSWLGYKEYAWGMDELHPISKTGSNWFSLGLTAIDALDTAWLMNEKEIFREVRQWIHSSYSVDQTGESNVFEITIRVLGGFLSAYNLSKDKLFLDKAVELADRLLHAFDSPSGIPYASINLKEKVGIPSNHQGGYSSTAEATTLQLELKYLSYLTDDPKYWNAAQKIMSRVFENNAKDGIVPIFINAESGNFVGSDFRLGSRADSYYEYLGKQWLVTNHTEFEYLKQYKKSVAGIRKHLLGYTEKNKFLFVGERPNGLDNPLSSKMDHLVCFLPATLAIVATNGKKVGRIERRKLSLEAQLDLDLAEELTRSCYEMYHQTKTGLAPEIVFWKESLYQDEKQPKKAESGEKHNDRLVKKQVSNTTVGPSFKQRNITLFNGVRRETVSPRICTDILAHHRQTDNLDDPPAPDACGAPSVPYDDETDANTRFKEVPDEPLYQDFDIHPNDGHNLLRPETVESLFVMYRITGKRKYREWGWKMFRAFDNWCKVESGGYSTLVSKASFLCII